MKFMSAKQGLRRALLVTTASILAIPAVSVAQETEAPEDEPDVIVVKGTIQQTIENSLDAKRETTVVSDAIIGVEIGDLPDLSIAESLERITGVTSDRFKGGASELSVRGLGAFLGSSTFNGREITSGSDGRDVNFGQFPSELIGGAQVFKSQEASFIEGGVSGIIELQTLRPLDYAKRRIQLQGLVGYSPYEDRVDDGEPYSGRYTASYVDQFETGMGDIGIAIGGQIRRDTAPEDIFTTSSTFRPCNTIEGIDQSNNCAYDTDANGNPTGASDVYFVSNQYIYRAQQTQADRDAVMANIQWQPNANWDINFDLQYSDRSDEELRHNLVVADGRRDIVPIEISPTGALLSWQTETRMENQSAWRVRDESYQGLGLTAEWSGDRLTVSGDIGYSKTERRQDEKDMRIRTNARVRATLDSRGVEIPNLTFDDVSAVESNTGLPFDLDNHDIYDNGARARRRLENIDDELVSFRLDGDYDLGGDFFTTLRAGTRWAERHRVNDDGIDETLSLVAGYDDPSVVATRRDMFPVEDLYDGADTAMTGITWATWEPVALFRALTGSDDAGLPMGSTLSPDDADISETTFAVYAVGDFEGEMFGKPIYGNVGVRAVKTDIESVGISTALETAPGATPGTIIVRPVGPAVTNIESNDFWNVLPSANLVFELDEDRLLRFALYNAIARPDPGAMSAALSFDDEAELDNIGSIVSASGNPMIEPLESTNFDISYEWYRDDDSAFSVAFYYKSLNTGFETVTENLTLIVDGTPTDVLVGRTANSDDSSSLWGLELTATHKFSDLPAPWNGFGVQAGFNYADSDFEFPDPTVPDGVNALRDFTDPANIPGYSEKTGNLGLFWENDDISMRLAYKARTTYFKPFRNDANRYVGDQDFLDFSASYDLTDHFELRFQALNILDEPNLMYRPTEDSPAQADFSGARVFFGLRARY